jgi:hypothetical protein
VGMMVSFCYFFGSKKVTQKLFDWVNAFRLGLHLNGTQPKRNVFLVADAGQWAMGQLTM